MLGALQGVRVGNRFDVVLPWTEECEQVEEEKGVYV